MAVFHTEVTTTELPALMKHETFSPLQVRNKTLTNQSIDIRDFLDVHGSVFMTVYDMMHVARV